MRSITDSLTENRSRRRKSPAANNKSVNLGKFEFHSPTLVNHGDAHFCCHQHDTQSSEEFRLNFSPSRRTKLFEFSPVFAFYSKHQFLELICSLASISIKKNLFSRFFSLLLILDEAKRRNSTEKFYSDCSQLIDARSQVNFLFELHSFH